MDIEKYIEEFKANLPADETLRKQAIADAKKYWEKVKSDNYNGEQATKIQLNSIYGALASEYFIAFNTDVAEAITLQGQDLIKYSEIIINRYFKSVWHLDVELHRKLGITVQGPILEDVTIYMDTDSAYVDFNIALKNSIGWDMEQESFGEKFVLAIYKHRLKEYFEKCFEIYAKKFNCENIQEFELELISRSALWLAKKKYVLNPTWKDPGVFIKDLAKMKPKGVEIVQSSTPPFARKKVVELLKYIMSNNDNFDSKYFIKMIREAKEEFKLSSIDEIAKGSSIGDYEKYILTDTNSFTIAPRCPIHVRAAGWYNHTINNKNLKSKYVLIRSGDKVKWYFTKELDNDNFAFLPNNFPIEIAPPIDYDRQFENVIIDPINRFLTAVGRPALPGNLIVPTALF